MFITQNINKIFKQADIMYDVANVPAGYRYWYKKLLTFMLSIFEYEGLPESLPSRELELCLLLQGYATPFYDGEEIVCVPTSIFGYDKYYKPTMGTYGNPLIMSKRLYFKDVLAHRQNAVLMFNDELHTNIFYSDINGGFNDLLCRYARRLADIESTENIYTVKLRMTSAPVGGDSAVNQNIVSYIKKMIVGDMKNSVTDDAVLSSFRSVEMGNGMSKETLMSIQAARDKILEQFLCEVGVKFRNSKKAQITEDESAADEQLLLVNPKNILKVREEGIDDFNKFFGTNAKVKLNPDIDRSNFFEGGAENDQTVQKV